MPLYVYQCQSCLETTEIIQKFSDPSIDVCIWCGGEVKRIIFPSAIIFKGDGWYATRDRKKNIENDVEDEE